MFIVYEFNVSFVRGQKCYFFFECTKMMHYDRDVAQVALRNLSVSTLTGLYNRKAATALSH